MGNPKGFLELTREEEDHRPIEERIHDWREMVIPAAPVERALELRARRWRLAAVLGGVLLTALLAGIVLRDARRLSVAEIGGSLETVAPPGWKLLGAAALVVWLALALVGVISARTQDSRSQRDGSPNISPYRHAKPASPGGRPDPGRTL